MGDRMDARLHAEGGRPPEMGGGLVAQDNLVVVVAQILSLDKENAPHTGIPQRLGAGDGAGQGTGEVDVEGHQHCQGFASRNPPEAHGRGLTLPPDLPQEPQHKVVLRRIVVDVVALDLGAAGILADQQQEAGIEGEREGASAAREAVPDNRRCSGRREQAAPSRSCAMGRPPGPKLDRSWPAVIPFDEDVRQTRSMRG